MKISRTAGVLLGTLVLVGGANVAVYAANGSPFIVGQTNRETKATVLKNTGAGPALNLQAKGAPLAVSNSKKVRKLNADKVDGKNAGQLTTKTYVYEVSLGSSSNTHAYITFPRLPDGQYVVTYRVGTYFGGAGTYTMSCYFSLTSGPALSTYAAFYDPGGHGTCSGSGVIDGSTINRFEVLTSDPFTASGTSQWTFTRINARIDKAPDVS